MPERPASDPPKPGSKLAEMRASGPTGFMRQVERLATAILPKQPPAPKAPPVAKLSEPEQAEVNAAHRAFTTCNAVKADKPKRVKRRPFEEVRPRQGEPEAIEEAKRIVETARAKTLKEERPWEKLGISRSSFFARRKEGRL